MPQGLFITFEGISGLGRAYYAQGLQRKLFSSRYYKYPNLKSPSGRLLAQEMSRLTPTQQSLLFGLNRWEDQGLIRKHLAHGTWVIADRYTFSGIAYARAQGVNYYQCFRSEEGLPQPDIVFYIHDPSRYDKVQDCYEELIDDTWVMLNVTYPQEYIEHLIWNTIQKFVRV